MGFTEDIENATGIDSEHFTWSSFERDTTAIWFNYPAQPIDWDTLQKLNTEFGVIDVKSESDGRTGSELRVVVND